MANRAGALEDLGMKPDFWLGREVLITGHTGFKGAWLSLWFHCLGARVHGYALDPPTVPNLFELAGVRSSLAGDMRAVTLEQIAAFEREN